MKIEIAVTSNIVLVAPSVFLMQDEVIIEDDCYLKVGEHKTKVHLDFVDAFREQILDEAFRIAEADEEVLRNEKAMEEKYWGDK